MPAAKIVGRLRPAKIARCQVDITKALALTLKVGANALFAYRLFKILFGI
jgi:hypothetical protein